MPEAPVDAITITCYPSCPKCQAQMAPFSELRHYVAGLISNGCVVKVFGQWRCLSCKYTVKNTYAEENEKESKDA